MRLDGDEGIVRVGTLGMLEMIGQLVEGLGARPACQAVLEDEHGMRGRVPQQDVNLLDCRQPLDWSRQEGC